MGDEAVDVHLPFPHQAGNELVCADALALPVLGAVGIHADEVHLPVPGGREVYLHGLQVDPHQDHGAPGPGQSQCVLEGAGQADAVVHHVEAAQEHAVAEHALVHLASGEAGRLLVEVGAQHDHLVRAAAPGHVGLVWEAGQDGDVAVGLDGADR